MDGGRGSGPGWPRLTLVVAAGILVGGCAAAATPSGTHHVTPPAQPSMVAPSDELTRVVIRENSFGPPEITVAVGVVTFVNADDEVHTVTEGENGAAAAGARFDVFIDIGESADVEFADPGDYLITCQFHSEMHLLVHAR